MRLVAVMDRLVISFANAQATLSMTFANAQATESITSTYVPATLSMTLLIILHNINTSIYINNIYRCCI